jgi:hypothetical protein
MMVVKNYSLLDEWYLSRYIDMRDYRNKNNLYSVAEILWYSISFVNETLILIAISLC